MAVARDGGERLLLSAPRRDDCAVAARAHGRHGIPAVAPEVPIRVSPPTRGGDRTPSGNVRRAAVPTFHGAAAATACISQNRSGRPARTGGRVDSQQVVGVAAGIVARRAVPQLRGQAPARSVDRTSGVRALLDRARGASRAVRGPPGCRDALSEVGVRLRHLQRERFSVRAERPPPHRVPRSSRVRRHRSDRGRDRRLWDRGTSRGVSARVARRDRCARVHRDRHRRCSAE